MSFVDSFTLINEFKVFISLSFAALSCKHSTFRAIYKITKEHAINWKGKKLCTFDLYLHGVMVYFIIWHHRNSLFFLDVVLEWVGVGIFQCSYGIEIESDAVHDETRKKFLLFFFFHFSLVLLITNLVFEWNERTDRSSMTLNSSFVFLRFMRRSHLLGPANFSWSCMLLFDL